MTSLMNLSTSAMFANSAQLQTIGHNIANANTPGYSRQQVELSNQPGQYTGAGFFGHGVKVDTVSRAHNEFLTREAALTQSQLSSDETRLTKLKQLEFLFPPGANGIGAAATELFNSFTDVASTPQDLSARQVALSSAEELAGRVRTTGTQIEALQRSVVADMKTDADTVNKLAEQVAKINDQVAAVHATGQPPNDLLDQRDQLVKQINEYVQVTTIPDADGSLGLFVGGGQVLVLGSHANSLTVTNDVFDLSQARLSLNIAGGSRELTTASIAGGSISGLLKFQDTDLVDARNMLGQMAAAITQRVNDQQSYGLDLTNVNLPVASRSGGAPLFSVAGPRVLSANTNAAVDTSVSVTVADATQLQASNYELDFDGSNFTLTRLSGPAGYSSQTVTQAQIAAGFSIDGMTIGPMTGTPPSVGDRIMIQPVSQAGANMQRVLSDPKGIAAALPVSATTASNNTGTAAVSDLTINAAPTTAPYASFYVYFSSSTGGLTADQYAVYDSSVTPPPGAAPQLVPTTTLTAGQPISYNGIQLSFTGVPRANDMINVDPTSFAASNNGNAKAMLQLRDDAMVGRTLSSSGTVLPGATAAQAYSEAMSNVGVRVQGAQATTDVSRSIAEDAAQQVSNQTGVNLDEEAARLIQFQQSYQAAAKILQVSQTIFNALLGAAAG